MSGELAHPGHVGYVRKWLTHNAERIAAVVEPPGEVDKNFTGDEFVRWVTNLVDQHKRCCDQEFARRPPFTAYTGD
jgi:hypothetical protein